MLLKDLMDDPPGGFDVQLIQPGVDIFRNIEGRPGEDLLHLPVVLHVAGVDHRHVQIQGPQQSGVLQNGLPLAVVRAPGQENQVGLDVPDVVQILLLQNPGGGQMQVGPGA